MEETLVFECPNCKGRTTSQEITAHNVDVKIIACSRCKMPFTNFDIILKPVFKQTQES